MAGTALLPADPRSGKHITLPQKEVRCAFDLPLPPQPPVCSPSGPWGASLIAQLVKNLPAMQETPV